MSNKAILIVDDDLDISACMQELFEGEGYPVLLAKNGKTALDLLAASNTAAPGLIFLDLMMPEMDGVSFLSELQRSLPLISSEIPIFVMSAGSDAHRLTIKTTGHLKKPLDLDELCEVAKRYCGG